MGAKIPIEYVKAAIESPDTPEWHKRKLAEEYGLPYEPPPSLPPHKLILKGLAWLAAIVLFLLIAVVARGIARGLFS